VFLDEEAVGAEADRSNTVLVGGIERGEDPHAHVRVRRASPGKFSGSR